MNDVEQPSAESFGLTGGAKPFVTSRRTDRPENESVRRMPPKQGITVSRHSVAQYRKTRRLLAPLLSVLLVLNSVAAAEAQDNEQPSSTGQSTTPQAAPQIVRLNLTSRVLQVAIRHAVSAQEDEERRRWKSLQIEMMGTPNEFMIVTLRDGSEVSGIIPVIFDDQIVVRVSSGERKLDRRTIRRITRIAPRNKQKAWTIGGLAGIAVAIPLFYRLTSDDKEFTKQQRIYLGFLIGAVGGGVIGHLAASGRRSVVIYEAV